jgi:hypothetical protein
LLADRIVERMIVRMDRDGDGAISRTEAESGHRIGRHDGEGRDGMGRRHD